MEELCAHTEYSFLVAASSFSSFTGLAASLVLASMVIILVDYKGDDHPVAAIALFTVALLALGLDTFIFGAAAGEVLCARADVQGLLGSGTAATGVVILMLGITLLQAKFKHAHAGLTLLGNVVTSLGALGCIALLALFAVRLVNNLTIMHLRPEPMASFAPSLIPIGIFLVTTAVVVLTGPGEQVRRAAIVITTCTYLLHTLIAFGMYATTLVLPTTQWSVHLDSLVPTLTIAISILFPLAELTGVIMALDWRGGKVRR
jgi:hypothetical protein